MLFDGGLRANTDTLGNYLITHPRPWGGDGGM